MHTLHLKDFIEEYHLYEHLEKLNLKILKGFHGLFVNLHGLLEKFHTKTLDKVFLSENVTDILVITSLFLMVLSIVRTMLIIQ